MISDTLKAEKTAIENTSDDFRQKNIDLTILL